jgi:hypothetical protein
MQQLLHDNYNDTVLINGEYYPTVDMNYGFAHFIAKYLDTMYPLLDENAKRNYEEIESHPETFPGARSISKPISIMNYFLCSNYGDRLMYNPNYYNDSTLDENKIPSRIYDAIYNRWMRASNIKNSKTGVIEFKPKYPEYFINEDPPLFVKAVKEKDDTTGEEKEEWKYYFNQNIIFPLETWQGKKEVCEIDDLVASYLLGRTIGPNSSMEDIYYVQKLLIRDRDIKKFEKGVWCPPEANENKIYDMTQTVISYQQSLVSTLNTNNVFVTGYFDIFTEACALKEVGAKNHGILGL